MNKLKDNDSKSPTSDAQRTACKNNYCKHREYQNLRRENKQRQEDDLS